MNEFTINTIEISKNEMEWSSTNVKNGSVGVILNTTPALERPKFLLEVSLSNPMRAMAQDLIHRLMQQGFPVPLPLDCTEAVELLNQILLPELKKLKTEKRRVIDDSLQLFENMKEVTVNKNLYLEVRSK